MGTYAETELVDYRLSWPTKENKRSFSVSFCSKQTEVFRFIFPLVPFSHLRNSENVETLKYCNTVAGSFSAPERGMVDNITEAQPRPGDAGEKCTEP
jgi:hypothetical protein